MPGLYRDVVKAVESGQVAMSIRPRPRPRQELKRRDRMAFPQGTGSQSWAPVQWTTMKRSPSVASWQEESFGQQRYHCIWRCVLVEISMKDVTQGNVAIGVSDCPIVCMALWLG